MLHIFSQIILFFYYIKDVLFFPLPKAASDVIIVETLPKLEYDSSLFWCIGLWGQTDCISFVYCT